MTAPHATKSFDMSHTMQKCDVGYFRRLFCCCEKISKTISAIVVSALSLTLAAPALAVGKSEEAEEMLAYVDAISPNIGQIESVHSRSAEFLFRNSSMNAEVPADADRYIKVESFRDSSSEIRIGFPDNLDINEGQLTSDGSMV